MQRCRSFLRKHTWDFKRYSVSQRQLHHVNKFISELSSRGLIADKTAPNDTLESYLTSSRTLYCGIDPTAGSLHVGNLVPLLNLLHFQLAGHQSIALLGGATGLIGDPSGRDEERPLQASDAIRQNSTSIRSQLDVIFNNAMTYASKRMRLKESVKPIKVMNNLDWWQDMSLINFLQSTGKHMRLAPMLSRESVKNRMSSASGISFAEFSYQLLQAYDFWYLYKHHSCRIQIGGSDQWGNIVSGLDLILRKEPELSADEKAYGITTPLLTTSSGLKFGKSAGNAVWLDSNRTSVFDFYQFFWRTTDADVEKYLNIFTFIPPEEITTIIKDHKVQPDRRLAQRLLAREVTEMIHGGNRLSQAEAATRLLFDTDLHDIRLEDAAKVLENDPRHHPLSESELVDVPLTKLAAKSGLVQSRGEASRLIQAKGLYLNNTPVQSIDRKLQKTDLLGGHVAVLRAGKDKHAVLVIRDS